MNSGFDSDRKSDSSDAVKEAKPEAALDVGVDEKARVSPMELDLATKGFTFQSENSGGGDDDDDVFDIGKVEIYDDDDENENRDGSSSVDLLSEFDDYVANEKDGMVLGTSRALSYGFEVGDLVWGKVKSHPWWPGHIFNEAFATSQVRRTRREGHVLVAFFGDSSYGWFDPAELIPFEPHFAEKSRQLNYRNFARAVEEAVDELSRRCAVGFVCKCRNPYNFRDTNVPGYFVVDVPDYEPGGVYSTDQIQKAREEFSPADMVALVKQLASAPHQGDEKSLSFIKNKATMFAYRKAVFEEYDETYAQAFGAPGRAASRNDAAASAQPVKPRAPLSGPLVIAEVLGDRKSATKPMKVKDHSKKDKYLFKRRDEASNVKPHQIVQGQAPSAFLEGSIGSGDGDYRLQKRAPSNTESGKEPENGNQGLTPGAKLSLKLSLDKNSGALLTQNVAVVTTNTSCSGSLVEGAKQGMNNQLSQPLKQEGEGMMDTKEEESAKSSGSNDNVQPPLSFPKKMEEIHESNEVQAGHSGGVPTPIKVKSSGRKNAVGGVKKPKVLKRPASDMDPEDSVMGDKKKKKKKKELDPENVRDPQRTLTSGKVSSTVGKVARNSKHVGLITESKSQIDHHKKDVAVNNDLSEAVGKLPILGNMEIELPQLVSDLQALALNPFHGLETNSPALVRKFFLHFRALVYQKSLVLSPPSESEPVEGLTSKPPSGVEASELSPAEPVKEKAAKPLSRSDDRTIAGRKRAPSDRQGEIAAKKSKKMSDFKSLAAERKMGHKSLEVQHGDVKETAVPAPRKSVKAGFVKKMEPPAKVVEPTTLVLKFPPNFSLPSPAELKAKFARFGPMDQSGLRVFYKSSTCRVVFQYKSDAQAALKFASNSSSFGNVNVRCLLREMDGPEVPASVKSYVDDTPSEMPWAKDSAFMPSPALRQRQQQSLSQSAVKPKSILKKSSGDEPRGQVTGGNGNSKGTARVKFMLGGEEPSRNEQLTVAGNRNNNFNNSASFADDGAPSSSTTTSSDMMNFNARNFQKVTAPPPSSLPPLLPLPPNTRPLSSQYAKALPPPPPPPHDNFSQQHSEATPPLPLPPPPPRNSHNVPNTASTFLSAPTVDISQQMLGLLTRCNDVVTNVKGLLGYVPYHPL